MEMKVSKTGLLLLVAALIILFAVSMIMYGKLNETILIQLVQQQNMQTDTLINKVFAKQREVDSVRKELAKTKDELSKVIAKSSAVITVTPAAPAQ
jgi:Na+-translocating ferredoxin:NAD+ oxidoreductase RnfG subunit